MKPGKQMQYSPEEIRKWKKLIYGTHNISYQVDEWVSNDQDTRKKLKRSKPRTKKYGDSKFGANRGSNDDSFSNSSYSNSCNSQVDEWLHSPGSLAKQSFKYK